MIDSVIRLVLSLLPTRVQHKIQAAGVEHKRIARDMVVVAGFLLTAKLIAAAKEMAIAWRYGVSSSVDAYLFVFNLVNWPVSLWLSVIMIVLVPLAARLKNDLPQELPAFRAELLGIAVLIGAVLSLFAWLGLPPLLGTSASGLPAATAELAIAMAHPLALLAMPGVLAGLLSAWMLAAGRHANTILEAVPALVILAALLIFPGPGTEPLVWGTLAGFAIHLGALAVPLAQANQIEAPSFVRRSPQWYAFWRSFGVMLAGQTLMSLATLIDQFFAARLGEGAIATLGYANRLTGLFLGLGATVVARATLPTFSRMHAAAAVETPRIAGRWALAFLAIGASAMIAAWWLAPWMVQILFERGAFTARDSTSVTEILRYSLPQMPFYFSGIVLVSLLASQQRYWMITLIASVNLSVKIAANFALIPILGVSGIVLANAVMYAAAALLCWRAVRVRRQ